MSVDAFMEHARFAGWEIRPPQTGTTDERVEQRAPDDLRAFLKRCGGVRCRGGVTVGQRIVAAQNDLLEERDETDRSVDWYVIAEEAEHTTAERIVIDLHPDRLGRCYEAFWDRFGVPGSMPVVARSFSELLERLRAHGGAPYWSTEQLDRGDAYD